MTPYTIDELLPVALVRAFVEDGGRTRAVMPEGRTEEVRAALTRMMVDPKLLLDFLLGLEDALRRAKVATPLYDLDDGGRDWPKVIVDGFEKLDPTALATLAVDPQAVEGLAEWLDALPAKPRWYQNALRDWATPIPKLPHWLAPDSTSNLCEQKPDLVVKKPTVPVGPETERRETQARALKEERGRSYRPLVAAVVLMPVLFLVGCAAKRDADQVSAQSKQHLDRAAELSHSTADADRQQFRREYEAAQAAQATAENNLVWRLFYGGDRQRLELLRKDYLVTKALQETVTESNRTWLTEGGIETTSTAFAKAFREVGLFPALRSGQQPEVVTKDDRNFCVEVLTKQFSENLAARQEVLSAIDHWLNILYLSKGNATKWQTTAAELEAITLATEPPSSETDPNKGRLVSSSDRRSPPRDIGGDLVKIRKLMADGKAEDMAEVKREELAKLLGYAKPSLSIPGRRSLPDSFDQVPPALLARVYGFFNQRGGKWLAIADQHAALVWVSHPDSSLINGLLEYGALRRPERTPADLAKLRQYTAARLAADKGNPLFWNAYANVVFDETKRKMATATAVLAKADNRGTDLMAQAVRGLEEADIAYSKALDAADDLGKRPYAIIHRNYGVLLNERAEEAYRSLCLVLNKEGIDDTDTKQLKKEVDDLRFLVRKYQTAAVREFQDAVRDSKLPGQSTEDDPVYSRLLGQALLIAGDDLRKAAEASTSAIEMFEKRFPTEGQRPDEYVYSLIDRAASSQAMGDFGPAAKDLELAARLRPNNALPSLNLGPVYLGLDRFDDAARETKRALKLDPNVLLGYQNLGMIDSYRGELKSAAETYREGAEVATRLGDQRWAKSLTDRSVGMKAMIDMLPALNQFAKDGTGEVSADLATLAVYSRRYTTASKILAALRKKSPELFTPASQLRVFAIGAAVRAGREGAFGDTERPDAETARALHKQAMEWAKADAAYFADKAATYDFFTVRNGEMEFDFAELSGLMHSLDWFLLSATRTGSPKFADEEKEWSTVWATLTEAIRKARRRGGFIRHCGE